MKLCAVVTALTLLVGCSSKSSAPAPVAASLPSGIDTAGMDKAVAPGDDFFAYANGGWIKKTTIPADKSEYGVATILVDQTRKQTVDIIQERVNGGPSASPDARKVGDFYASYMDEAGIEAKGLAPLKPRLEAIAGIADKRALAHAIGETLRADVDPLNAKNIADLAGLAAAYDAYHLSLNGKPAHDDNFFVGYAQSWRSKPREELIRRQIATDGHSPDEYRVATVRNLDPWYATFNVTPTQRMYLPPEKRVRVW